MNEINIDKEKKIDPLKTEMGKTYIKGLQKWQKKILKKYMEKNYEI